MRAPSLWVAGLLACLVAGCATTARVPAVGAGAASSAAAVERFLQLARQKDYVQMGWVFGTADGAFIQDNPRPEVERRMYGLAEVLANDSFTVGPGSPLPGRIGRAETFRVRLHRGSLTRQVPVTTVIGPDQRWFVEIVEIQAITNAP